MTSMQIRYFLTVADCMSFSEAARILYVSQPSVSRQIRFLEEELGCLLFDRKRKNAVRLSSAGIIYRDAFLNMRDRYLAAQTLVKELSAHASLGLRIGVGAGWDLSGELMGARKTLEKSYPQANLIFESMEFRELRRRIRTGDLDAIICTKTSVMDFEGLEVVQLANLESRAYVKKGLLRDEGEAVTAADFDGQTLLGLTEEESPMAMELALLQFQARQVKVLPRYLSNRDSIYQALLMGEGVSVFDQYMQFSADPRLCWFDLEDNIPICLLWSRTNQNPLIRLFADAMLAEMEQAVGKQTGRFRRRDVLT